MTDHEWPPAEDPGPSDHSDDHGDLHGGEHDLHGSELEVAPEHDALGLPEQPDTGWDDAGAETEPTAVGYEDWADWLHEDQPADSASGLPDGVIGTDDLADAQGWLEAEQPAVAALDWRPDDPWADLFADALDTPEPLDSQPLDGLPWSDPATLADVAMPDPFAALDHSRTFDSLPLPEDPTDAETAVAQWLDAR